MTIRRTVPLAAILFALHCAPAFADPNDYVLDLDITQGEDEIDAKLGAANHSPDGTTPAAQAAAISWGRGITEHWMTEVYAQFANGLDGNYGGGGGFDGVSWENVVRFAEAGEWPVDVGAMLEIERPRDSTLGWSVTTGPLLQADFYQFQINANALFTRFIDGQPHVPLQFGYQLQLKYRAEDRFEYGAQAFGDVGAWNQWNTSEQQSHRVGPAIFGRFKLGQGRAIRYNAALLFGTTNGAPAQTLRAQIEYEY